MERVLVVGDGRSQRGPTYTEPTWSAAEMYRGVLSPLILMQHRRMEQLRLLAVKSNWPSTRSNRQPHPCTCPSIRTTKHFSYMYSIIVPSTCNCIFTLTLPFLTCHLYLVFLTLRSFTLHYQSIEQQSNHWRQLKSAAIR